MVWANELVKLAWGELGVLQPKHFEQTLRLLVCVCVCVKYNPETRRHTLGRVSAYCASYTVVPPTDKTKSSEAGAPNGGVGGRL